MTIRKKIFLLTGILLALFGVVVGVLAMVQKLNSDQIGNILAYELPLLRLATEFDVYTDRYELVILRVLRQGPENSSEVQAAASSRQVIADQLRADLATATALLDKAIHDQNYQTADRVDLARIAGSFKYLSHNLEDFLTVGELTMRKMSDGQREKARAASYNFAKFAQAFGQTYSKFAAPVR